MGERFIKIIFDHARINEVDEIYVTIFEDTEDKKRFIQLFKTFDFKFWGEKSDTGEKVMVRNLIKESLNLFSLYPRINSSMDAYILPIRPEYHTKLLPDCILFTEWKGPI